MTPPAAAGARRRVRIATRKSRLALRQAETVACILRRVDPQLEVELVPVTTAGDRFSTSWERHGVAPAALEADPERQAQVGAFVKELEHALLEGRADLAVHSLKDVPTRLPAGLLLGAYPVREDPRDAVVFPEGPGVAPARSGPAPSASGPAPLAPGPAWLAPGPAPGVAPQAGRAPEPVGRSCAAEAGSGAATADGGLARLREGARVGTSSLRRLLQIRALRPDVVGVTVRGNVDTRIAKLDSGQADALVLAGAGLLRLGLGERIGAWLDPQAVVPAPGQGALAVECRADDLWLREWLERLDNPRVRIEVAAERGFLEAAGAGCRWPVGALATVEGAPFPALRLVAFLALPAGEAGGGEGGLPADPDGESGLEVRRGEVDGWVFGRASLVVNQPGSETEAWRLGAALAARLLHGLARPTAAAPGAKASGAPADSGGAQPAPASGPRPQPGGPAPGWREVEVRHGPPGADG